MARPSGHSTQRRAHAAVVHCAALGQHGRGHGVKSRQRRRPARKVASQYVRHVSTMRTHAGSPPARSAARPAPCVGAPVARVTSRPCGVEHQRGRRAQDPEPADQRRGGARRRPRRARPPARSRPRRRARAGWRGRARRTPRRTGAASPARPASAAQGVPSRTDRGSGSRRLATVGRRLAVDAAHPVGAAEPAVGQRPEEPEAQRGDDGDDEDPGYRCSRAAQQPRDAVHSC